MPKVKKVQTPGSFNLEVINKKKKWKLKMKMEKKKVREKKEQKKAVGRPPVKSPRTPRSGEKRIYTADDLDRAVALCRDRGMAVAKAARVCGVPRITLDDKLKGRHQRKNGRPTALTKLEEMTLVDQIVLLGKFNFPLTKRHLRDMVKSYLDRKERETRFPKNRPGKKWAISFVKRHADKIVLRRASNIRRSRAAVSPAVMRAFFANLAKELDGVPPTHIFNCDETNLADNPSMERCLFAKGVKYPEQEGIFES